MRAFAFLLHDFAQLFKLKMPISSADTFAGEQYGLEQYWLLLLVEPKKVQTVNQVAGLGKVKLWSDGCVSGPTQDRLIMTPEKRAEHVQTLLLLLNTAEDEAPAILDADGHAGKPALWLHMHCVRDLVQHEPRVQHSIIQRALERWPKRSPLTSFFWSTVLDALQPRLDHSAGGNRQAAPAQAEAGELNFLHLNMLHVVLANARLFEPAEAWVGGSDTTPGAAHEAGADMLKLKQALCEGVNSVSIGKLAKEGLLRLLSTLWQGTSRGHDAFHSRVCSLLLCILLNAVADQGNMQLRTRLLERLFTLAAPQEMDRFYRVWQWLNAASGRCAEDEAETFERCFGLVLRSPQATVNARGCPTATYCILRQAVDANAKGTLSEPKQDNEDARRLSLRWLPHSVDSFQDMHGSLSRLVDPDAQENVMSYVWGATSIALASQDTGESDRVLGACIRLFDCMAKSESFGSFLDEKGPRNVALLHRQFSSCCDEMDPSNVLLSSILVCWARMILVDTAADKKAQYEQLLQVRAARSHPHTPRHTGHAPKPNRCVLCAEQASNHPIADRGRPARRLLHYG